MNSRLTLIAVCLFALLAALWVAPAFCQSQKPQLVVQIGHTDPILSVAFSPDGRTLASASDDRTVKLWDAATGQLLRTLNGQLLRTLNDHTEDVNSVVFSPDGRTLASASDDRTVKLWDAATGQLLRTLIGHTDGVEAVAFSPDGRTLASASADKTIKLWDAATGQLLRTLTGHTDSVLSVAFSPDGKTLASGSWDKTINLWDAVTGKMLHTFASHAASVLSVAFSPDGRTLASAGYDKTIRLWDTKTGQLLRTLTGHTDSVKSVAFSPDGRTLASASWDKTVKLWDAATGQQLRTLTGHTGGVNGVAFSSDGRTLASAGDGRSIKFWDAVTGQQLRTLTGHIFHFGSVAFSPDGRTLASASWDKTVKLWDAATGQQLRTLTGHTDQVTSVAFSPNGKMLASGSEDNTVKLWDIATGRLLHTLTGHTYGVTSVAFGPDGKTLASGGSMDKTVKIWDTATGQLLRTLIGHTDWVEAVAFSPDGRTLASGSQGFAIKLWDTATGKMLYTFTGHTDYVQSVAFSQDGKTLTSASDDGNTEFWDAATGQEIASRYVLGDTDWAVVTPDGRFDASPGGLTQMHYVVGLEPIDLAQLKDRYYEPGLLAKLLGFNKEPLRDVQAFDHVDLTPEVKAPDAVAADGRLPLTLTNRGGGIGRVQVFVNGKELQADARGPKPDPTARTAALTVDVSHAPGLVPGKPNTVRVVTWNAEGYLSSRGTEAVYTPPGQADVTPPDLWAVVGGISDYAGPGLHLTYPAKDAGDFARALTLAAKNLFGSSKVHLTLLDTGGQPGALTPTKANLRKAFGAARQARPGDVFVVYLAGHGVALPGPPDSSGTHDLYCYLTQDATTGSPAALSADATLRSATTVSSEELTDWIKQVPAQKQVMVLDTCAAGAAAALLTSKRDVPSGQIRAIERLKDRTGFYVLMGCAADSVSYETSRYRQGLLTYALLKGMKGAKLREGQYVDVSGLFNYAVDEAPQLAQDIGGVQRPFVAAPQAGSFDVGRLTEQDRAAIPLASAGALLLRPELLPDGEDLNLEEMLTARLRDESARPRGDGDAPAPSFIDAAAFPGAVQPRGTYAVVGQAVTVTLKLRRDGLVIKTLTVTGSRADLPGLVTELTSTITGAVGTP